MQGNYRSLPLAVLTPLLRLTPVPQASFFCELTVLVCRHRRSLNPYGRSNANALLEFKEQCQNPNCRSWFPAGTAKSHICYQKKNHNNENTKLRMPIRHVQEGLAIFATAVIKIVDIAEGRVELSKHKTMKGEPLCNGSYGAVFLGQC